jgi:CubicO group peptidase (beta-lactamase class C family)
VQATKSINTKTGNTWPLHENYNQIALSDTLQKYHQAFQSTDFLIIKNGRIFSQKYYLESHRNNISGVWSVTKTYTSLLILKAIEDGLIESIDDPVSKYLPEWKVEQTPPLSLRHLASMSSGLYWEELDQKPFSLIARLNFYDNLEKFVYNYLYAIGILVDKQHYDSGATQILGMVLKKVLQGKSITAYLEEKFWIPLECENNALFIIDSEKHQNEKTFGGLVATARDISRLGLVISKNGMFQNKQILNDEQMKMLSTIPYNNKTYAYGIWTGEYEGKPFYYQSGHRGQFIISFPAEQLVITRLGHQKLKKDDQEDVSKETYFFIKEALKMIEQQEKVM